MWRPLPLSIATTARATDAQQHIWLESVPKAHVETGHTAYHGYHDQPIVRVKLSQYFAADPEAGSGEERTENRDGDNGGEYGRSLIGVGDFRGDDVGHGVLLSCLHEVCARLLW